jgi:hypothetical protein
MTMLNKEIRAFAIMLGHQLNKFDPESVASSEYTDIAEFRLSRMLGLDQGSPEFQRIWNDVFDIACSYTEDEPSELLPNDTVPPDAAFVGMPNRRWKVGVFNGAGHEIASFDVDARTREEACRKADPERKRMGMIGAMLRAPEGAG